MLPNSAFWADRRVLLTGHTGFKGGWLALWLQRLGAQVTGIALPPLTHPNLFTLARIADGLDSQICDLRDAVALAERVRAAAPEVIFHLAAQPLVRTSYRDPLTTFASNLMGTAHMLDALRGLHGARVAVMITTDKVYRNREWHHPYREDDSLGGHDPYSASKAASELIIDSYRASFLAVQGVAVASARAGNVIGGGDWSDERLLPDAIRAWGAGQCLQIRYPEAIRPWQHVLEPLAGYLRLAEILWAHPELAGAYNFGPETHEVATVCEVIELARAAWGDGRNTGGAAIAWETEPEELCETGCLTLEIAKSRRVLGFKPRWALAVAVKRTIDWYRQQHAGADVCTLCSADFADYTSNA